MEKRNFNTTNIGKLVFGNETYVKIDSKYHKALGKVELFSHVHVFYQKGSLVLDIILEI